MIDKSMKVWNDIHVVVLKAHKYISNLLNINKRREYSFHFTLDCIFKILILPSIIKSHELILYLVLWLLTTCDDTMFHIRYMKYI